MRVHNTRNKKEIKFNKIRYHHWSNTKISLFIKLITKKKIGKSNILIIKKSNLKKELKNWLNKQLSFNLKFNSQKKTQMKQD